MRAFFTNGQTELENGRVQTWYGHTRDVQLEDFLPKTYAKGAVTQQRFEWLANTFLSGNKKDVLEIGAGSGDLSVYCSTLYPDNSYTVSDISPDMLNRFFPRTKKWFNSDKDFRLAYFPVEHIPFADESFDVVLMKSTVHHFDDFNKAFTEIRRVLKKGGKAVFLHDPVCLNIPVWRQYRNLTFAYRDRLCGSNCRIYPFRTYLSCGKGFTKIEWQNDPVWMKEIQNNRGRTGWKKWLFSKIEKNPMLFGWFFEVRFGEYIFYFTK